MCSRAHGLHLGAAPRPGRQRHGGRDLSLSPRSRAGQGGRLRHHPEQPATWPNVAQQAGTRPTPTRLAIQRNVRPVHVQPRDENLRPRNEYSTKCCRVDGREHTPKHILRRHAVRKIKKTREPLLIGVAPMLHRLAVVTATRRRHERDHESPPPTRADTAGLAPVVDPEAHEAPPRMWRAPPAHGFASSLAEPCTRWIKESI